MIFQRRIGNHPQLPLTTLLGLILLVSAFLISSCGGDDPTDPGGDEDTTAPSSVTDFRLKEKHPDSISLMWTAVGDDGGQGRAHHYEIRYSTSAISESNFNAATEVAGVSTPGIAGNEESCEITDLSPDTEYHIGLKVHDEAGNASSLTTISQRTPLQDDMVSPAEVDDLVIQSISPTMVRLAWTAVGDDGSTGSATRYEVRYSLSEINSGNWEDAIVVVGVPTPGDPNTTDTCEVSGLSEATTYHFGLMVFDESGNSSGPATVSGSTSAILDEIAPAAVTDLRLTVLQPHSVQLTWTAVGDDGTSGSADRYEVRYSLMEINEGNWADATEVAGVPTPGAPSDTELCEILGLDPATTYHIGLMVFDEAGNHPEPATITTTTPAVGEEALVLEPLWAIGEEDDDVFFGIVKQIAVNNQGQICILDVQLSEISIFSTDGEFIGTRGREGDGPGEFRNPVGMVQFDSGTYGVVNGFPSKIVKLLEDGTPAGSCVLDSNTGDDKIAVAYSGLWENNRLVVGGAEQSISNEAVIHRDYFIRAYDENCVITAGFWSQSVVLDLAVQPLQESEWFFPVFMGILPDGRLALSEKRNVYEISLYNESGLLTATLNRSYIPWTRNALALELAGYYWDEQVRQLPPEYSSYTLESTEPDISDIVCRPDGTIWVQTSRARWEPPAGTFTVYDVFDAAGSFDRKVAIVCDGNAVYDRLFFTDEYVFRVGGFWLAGLTGAPEFETDYGVYCYRLPE